MGLVGLSIGPAVPRLPFGDPPQPIRNRNYNLQIGIGWLLIPCYAPIRGLVGEGAGCLGTHDLSKGPRSPAATFPHYLSGLAFWFPSVGLKHPVVFMHPIPHIAKQCTSSMTHPTTSSAYDRSFERPGEGCNCYQEPCESWI